MATINNGAAPYTFVWRNGNKPISNASSITVTNAGTYSVTVTDSKGCAATFAKTIVSVNVACKIDKKTSGVQVCAYNGKGSSTVCLQTNKVDASLKSGARLGACGTTSAIAATERQMPELESDALTVMVAPNPSTSQFTIKVTSGLNQSIALRVFNEFGKLVEIRNGLLPGQTHQIGSRYPSGMYLLEVVQGTERKTLKLLKTRE